MDLISADNKDLSQGHNLVVAQLQVVTTQLCLSCANRVKSTKAWVLSVHS